MKNTVTIDGAGRMVMPKEVRDQFGLRCGSEIELRVGPDTITLCPIADQPSLTKERGLYVHEGRPESSLLDAVDLERKGRDRAVWGTVR